VSRVALLFVLAICAACIIFIGMALIGAIIDRTGTHA
jgi:hypothetical protein